jgi:hypothetical protein
LTSATRKNLHEGRPRRCPDANFPSFVLLNGVCTGGALAVAFAFAFALAFEFALAPVPALEAALATVLVLVLVLVLALAAVPAPAPALALAPTPPLPLPVEGVEEGARSSVRLGGRRSLSISDLRLQPR